MPVTAFVLSEYLPGRDFGCQSVWKDGKLVLIKTYERLLTLAPRHATANFNLGICYEKLGRWQEATDAFTKALEVDPQREEAQLGLGICLLHQEKPEPAIGCFDKVLARQPGHETATFGNRSATRRPPWRCSGYAPGWRSRTAFQP